MRRRSRDNHEVVLSLTEVESRVLGQLLDDLEEWLIWPMCRPIRGAANPVIDRLFPDGYDDAGAPVNSGS